MFGTDFLLPWSTDMTHATAYIRTGSHNVRVSVNSMITDLSVLAFDVKQVSLYNNGTDAEVRHFIKMLFTNTQDT